jgi:hypothetical protein
VLLTLWSEDVVFDFREDGVADDGVDNESRACDLIFVELEECAPKVDVEESTVEVEVEVEAVFDRLRFASSDAITYNVCCLDNSKASINASMDLDVG